MSTTLLIAVIVVAAAGCPLHMWWQQRRGRQAACCPPSGRRSGPSDLEALRARQQELTRQIALARSAPERNRTPCPQGEEEVVAEKSAVKHPIFARFFDG